MNRQLTLGEKMTLCFGSMCGLSLLLGASAWVIITTLQHEIDDSVQFTARKIQIVSDIRTSVLTYRLAERGILMFSAAKMTDKVQVNIDLFAKSVHAIDGQLRELRSLETDAEGRQLIDSVESNVAEYARLQAEIPRLCAAGKVVEAVKEDAAHLLAPGTATVKSLDKMVAMQRDAGARAVASADGVAYKSHLAAALLILLNLASAGFAAFIVARSTRGLRAIAGELAEGAAQISSASGQVASSSQTLAQGSSEQAASLEETSSSSEEISSMTRQNAENSRLAAENMLVASKRVEDANSQLALMVNSMNEINTSSDRISKIIKVIDEIAFQTNILALNAAVEAARAGEAGMGFAVVADEVRNLAQRCTQAARDTAGLIEESIARSNDGKTKLDQVAAAIGSINASAAQVKTLIEEVSLGSREQARGIEQVAKAITQMERVTQATAASAEQGASASQELSAQSETVRSIVTRLTDLVGSAT